MSTGTVGFFHDRKGYGFVETDDSDDDAFFHMDDVDGPNLEEGQELEFDIESSPKGPRAANIRRAEARLGFPVRLFGERQLLRRLVDGGLRPDRARLRLGSLTLV